MKKQSILFIAGALLVFASCQSENAGYNSDNTDSTVNARVEEIRLEMMMQNDSIINALAQQRADSIIAAMKGGNTVTTQTTTKRTTTVRPSGSTTKVTSPEPSSPTKTAQDQRFEDRQTGNRTITEEKKKEQDDKFNRRGN